jgi:AcrR family transcriptional regulator
LPQSKTTEALPRRAGRPSGAEAERLGDAMLDAAKRLFMEQGFAATSMEAIAEEAGVTRRTLYRHLPDKVAVFEAAVRRHAAEHAMPALPPDPGATLEVRLLAAADHILDWILQPEVLAMYRVTVAEALRFPVLAGIVFAIPVAETTATIQRILAEAAPAAAAADLCFAAEQFMHAVASGPFHKAVQGIEPPGLTAAKRERAHRGVRLFLSGAAQALR